MTNEAKQPYVELGAEFVAELLLFLYPYGADQMGLPHNFWLGLGCWVFGSAIAIRMFWIFPLWAKRLSPLAKGIIAFLCAAAFIWGFYSPVVAAHAKWVTERSASESRPKAIAEQPTNPSNTSVSSAAGNQTTAAPTNKPIKHKHPSPRPSKPSQDNSGSVGGSVTQGPCSNFQNGGNGNQASTNCTFVDTSEKNLVITEPVAKEIATALQASPHFVVKLWAVGSTDVQGDFVILLEKALSDAGFDVGIYHTGVMNWAMTGPTPKGISCFHGHDSDPVIEAMGRVLLSNHVIEKSIPCRIGSNMEGWFSLYVTNNDD
jgi:hypothetical protein